MSVKFRVDDDEEETFDDDNSTIVRRGAAPTLRALASMVSNVGSLPRSESQISISSLNATGPGGEQHPRLGGVHLLHAASQVPWIPLALPSRMLLLAS